MTLSPPVRKPLAACLIALVLLLAPIAAAQQRQPISVIWKSPVKDPICLAMSAGGRYCGVVDKGGVVRIYGPGGKLAWERKVPGATDVMIARNGQSVLVYSKLNPVYQQVYFFRSDGRKLWTHRIEGCVWSGAVSADGLRAAVTTGERFIYVYKPDPNRPRYRRWRLEGIGYAVLFTPDNKRVVVGAWQDSMLACYDLDGRFQWRCRCAPDRQYELHCSADSRSILGLIPGTQYKSGAEIRFWDSGGKLRWTRPLDGFDARALVSPQSQYVAVSYASYISRKDEGIIERKVAVYRSDGRPAWEKGGLFFGPRLIALSPNGSSVIVSDGEHSIYNMDQRGRILSKLDLKASIRRAVSTEDGSRILMHCGDGWLYLMGVGQ